MIEELCEKIWSQDKFQLDREALISSGIKTSIGEAIEFTDTEAIQRLLQCAMNMAISEKPLFRNTAYEITISTIKLIDTLNEAGVDPEGISEISSAVLNRLGNFPASNFCSNELNNNGASFYIPSTLWMENEFHRSENTVRITNDESITFTNFQRDLWKSLETKKV